jgi:hypothetical protein
LIINQGKNNIKRVRTYSCASFGRLVDCGNGPWNDNLYFALTEGDTCFPYIATYYYGNYTGNYHGILPLKTGHWNHLAATMQGNTAYFYVNGVLSSTRQSFLLRSVVRNNCYIGRSNWNDPIANALFDEIKFFNRYLTQQEIINDMNLNKSLIIEI